MYPVTNNGNINDITNNVKTRMINNKMKCLNKLFSFFKILRQLVQVPYTC